MRSTDTFGFFFKFENRIPWIKYLSNLLINNSEESLKFAWDPPPPAPAPAPKWETDLRILSKSPIHVNNWTLQIIQDSSETDNTNETQWFSTGWKMISLPSYSTMEMKFRMVVQCGQRNAATVWANFHRKEIKGQLFSIVSYCNEAPIRLSATIIEIVESQQELLDKINQLNPTLGFGFALWTPITSNSSGN